MVTVGGQSGHSALDATLDSFRMRQHFNVVVRARDVATVRRGLLSLPSDRQPARGQIFGRLRGAAPHR